MKIAIIGSCSFPPSEGLATHILSLSHYLQEKKHDITVFVRRRGNGPHEVVTYRDVKFVLIPSSSYPAISSIIFRQRLQAYLKSSEFDVIHYHSPLVAPLLKQSRLGQRVLTTFHSTMKADTKYIEPVSVHAVLNKAMGALISPFFERRLILASDTLIAVSEDVKKELIDLYSVPPERINVIINGVNSSIFYNRGNERKKSILFLGRLGYRKGLPELFDAIKRYLVEGGKYRFVFAGDGPLAGLLCEYIEREYPKNTVEWLGNVSESNVPDLLSSSEFLVMPSSYETGPRVVLEAMACGTPVIATQVGLLKKISPNNFIKIEQTETGAIFDALKRAENLSRQKYRTLADESLDVSKQFSSEVTYARVLHEYR